MAAERGSTAIASELIKSKADVNHQDRVSRGDKLTWGIGEVRCGNTFVGGWEQGGC